MNIWDIIQNPIIIGLFAGVVVYIYMKNEKKDQKNKNINLLIPLVVFIAFVFISHVYFECYDSNEISPVVVNKPIMPPMNKIYQSYLKMLQCHSQRYKLLKSRQRAGANYRR